MSLSSVQSSKEKNRYGAKWHIVIIILLLLLVQGVAWGQTAGPNFPGTGADVTGVGTVTWTNTGNLGADDNVYTTISLTTGSTASHYLQATNYGFAIPAGSTINGIQVTIGRFQNITAGGTDIRDVSLYLLKGGSIAGTNQAATFTEWPNSITGEQPASYGGTTNLWGTTWTPADINASNFGVALSVNTTNVPRTGSVDYMTITITYTPPPLYFRSAASGNWNSNGTWEQSEDNITWIPATRTPSSADYDITIKNGNNVTVTAAASADQCTIEAGGQVTVTTNTGGGWTIANGSVPGLTVNGTVVNSGTMTMTGTAVFNSGSIYQHARDGGTIPTARRSRVSTTRTSSSAICPYAISRADV